MPVPAAYPIRALPPPADRPDRASTTEAFPSRDRAHRERLETHEDLVRRERERPADSGDRDPGNDVDRHHSDVDDHKRYRPSLRLAGYTPDGRNR